VIGKKTWIGGQDNELFGHFWQECQSNDLLEGMETYLVPATQWAVFECRGKVPMSIVQAEMFAFMEWLPKSGYEHALAPEMEVYTPGENDYCEFWLPIRPKSTEVVMIK
jgi:AraC family transcriptional regulator